MNLADPLLAMPFDGRASCARFLLAVLCAQLSASAFAYGWGNNTGGNDGAVLQLEKVVIVVERTRPIDAPRDLTVVVTATGSPPSGPGSKTPGAAQTAPVAADANTEPDRCGDSKSPSSKNPVIIATGEKYKDESDIVAGSTYGLDLRRTYRSFNTSAKMFGPKWMSTYDYRTLVFTGCYRDPDYPNRCFPTSILYSGPDGASYTYTRFSGLQYKVRNSASAGVLEFDGLQWVLYKNRTYYYFSSPGGVIQRIADSGGVTLQTYEYPSASSNRPTRILNRGGQAISFTWSGTRISAVTDPAGNVWSYTYNSNGMLATVTSPGPSPDVRTYHYEDATDATLLTGISVNSVRYSTYSYYPDKRVQVSGLAGGEERDTFAYGA